VKPEIVFEKNDKNQLTVTIETDRLHMQSVAKSDLACYSQLFSNPHNMSKYGYGQPWLSEITNRVVGGWVNRWENNDPFSSFAISKNDIDVSDLDESSFIGHVVLGYGDKPGSAELGYAFDNKYWGQGYGKEAVNPIVREYASELIEHGYKIKGEDFDSIVATTREDNIGSIRILENTGMKCIREEFKYEHNRYVFFINTAELKKPQDEVLTQNCESTPYLAV
jgi:[ribosomal protein S5]-alanine N-acetyltransferase